MLGAIVGDIAGSRFEWRNRKSKHFTLLSHEKRCRPADDSIMTLAVAQAILDTPDHDPVCLGKNAVMEMQRLGRLYPRAGYGGRFCAWIANENPQPYYSWGNGAAMRVSPCGFAASTLEEAKAMARAVTEVTHNHPEGLRGAEAAAAAVFLAGAGKTKEEIRAYITENYYNINFTLDEIRPSYTFDVSCQGSVPQALEAFFEADGFEDTLRNAISLGGDSDTLAAIAGGPAEAYYGIPQEIREAALAFLDEEQLSILNAFEAKYGVYGPKTR